MLFPKDCERCKNYKQESASKSNDNKIHYCSRWNLEIMENDNSELTEFTFPIDCFVVVK